jgi:hypothetical protein
MHQHVGDPRQLVLERGADLRGNLVGCHHRHGGIDLDVYVNVILQPCFPRE